MARNTTPWTKAEPDLEDAIPVLEVVRGAEPGRQFVLRAATTVIGHEGADLVLTETGVSRRHAQLIVAADNAVTVMDLGSTNGTRVNGVLVGLAPLTRDDTLSLGPSAELRLLYVPKRSKFAEAGLSARQLQVAKLVASGLSNTEIADQLAISPHTVARHLENIYARLGVGSRTALASWMLGE